MIQQPRTKYAHFRHNLDVPSLWVEGCPTHLGVLHRLLMATGEPVVEFGAGFYTTPLMVAAGLTRPAVTIEDNQKFVDFFTRVYHESAPDDLHPHGWSMEKAKYHPDSPIPLVRPDDYLLGGPYPRWGVALVDSRPTDQRRYLIQKLRECARYIVVHDTEPDFEWLYKWGDSLSTFKYRVQVAPYAPWTTVLSDTDDAEKIMRGYCNLQSDLTSAEIEKGHKT